MDKQQATDHILSRLQAGYQAEEIADELGRLLKAPTDKVKPFVDQVEAGHPEVVAPAQTDHAVDQSTVTESTEIPTDQEQPEASPQDMGTGFSDLPPGLQAIIQEAESAAPRPVKPAAVAKPKENPEIALPRQAEFVAPSEKKEASEIDLEALSEFTFKQLKKQRRHNDIVEDICQKTGWHWNKSQRFVARVQTKHHDELQSGKNRLTLFVGIGIVLVGLIMALIGASALSDYAKLAVFAKTNPEVLLDVSPSATFFALSATVTGIGMVLGGGFGIARALTNR
jgi:hypothetical protein